MKNATAYEKQVKKLLTGAKKSALKAPAPEQYMRFLIEAILQADATVQEAEKAMVIIEKEFVDYNELRVCQSKELAECLGKDHPDARGKAQTIITVLNGIADRASSMSMDYMREMGKREVRRHLRELGLTPYAEAVVSMACFDVHAIPVDSSLFELLQMEELIHPESDVDDTQSFLERIVPQKNGGAAHGFFREYVAKNAKALAKKREEEARKKAELEEIARQAAEEATRKAEEKARKKAEEEQRKAEENARLEAEQLAKAEAEKVKAKQAKIAKKAEEKKAKAAAKKAASAKVAAKKTVKKTAKKPAVKKTAKKAAAKKTAPSAASKPVKKTAKKTAKKK